MRKVKNKFKSTQNLDLIYLPLEKLHKENFEIIDIYNRNNTITSEYFYDSEESEQSDESISQEDIIEEQSLDSSLSNEDKSYVPKQSIKKINSIVNKNQNQKSILRNKSIINENYKYQEQHDNQFQEQVPFISDITFEDNNDIQTNSNLNQFDPLILKKFQTTSKKKRTSLEKNTMRHNSLAYNQKQQNLMNSQNKIESQMDIQQNQDNQYYIDLKQKNESDSQISQFEIPKLGNIRSNFFTQSVKFKIPSPRVSINKGDSLPQIENLLMSKQSSLRNKESRKQQNGKSQFYNNDQNTPKSVKSQFYNNDLNSKQNNNEVFSTKKPNKVLQKFISYVKSGSFNRKQSNVESRMNLDNTLLTSKLSQQQSIKSPIDKKDHLQIGQKIKSNIQTLVESFSQIQDQLSQYNTIIHNNESNFQQLRHSQIDIHQFEEEFEKMKLFEVYFPQNNYNVILYNYKVQKAQRKKLLKIKKKIQTLKQDKKKLALKPNIKKVSSQIQ